MKKSLSYTLLLAVFAACPKPILAPTAAATAESASVGAGTAVRLDGKDSKDPQSRDLAFSWSFVSLPAGSKAELNQPHAVAPSFTTDVVGEYVVQLVVSNGVLASKPVQVTVTATGCGVTAPTIDKVQAETGSGAVGTAVQLSATVSDTDNDVACGQKQTFSYDWKLVTLPATSRATLNNPQATKPGLVPDVPGDYVVRLTVTDSTGRPSLSKEVTVTATTCGSAAPGIKSVATTPTSAGVGTTVQLSATVADPDNLAGCDANQQLSYEWSLRALPAGSSATLNSTSSLNPSFKADRPGDYLVRLVVTDSTGRSSSPKDTTVTVTACGAAAPVVTLVTSLPTAVGVGTIVQLGATADDADNAPACGAKQLLRYEWTLRGQPAGSRAQLSSAGALNPFFTADVAGDYLVRLVVTDSTGLTSAPTDVTLTATACGSGIPELSNATATPSSPNTGQKVALAVKVTDADNDPNGCKGTQTFSYAWTLEGKPAGSSAVLSDPAAAAPSFTPDLVGSYLLGVVVTDSTGKASAKTFLSVGTTTCGTASPTSTITAAPVAPVIGNAVTLTATITDADNIPTCSLGQTFTRMWQLTVKPNGSQAVISDPAASSPSFTPDVVGTYQVSLVVTDSTGRASQQTFATVTTAACGKAAPSAVVSAAPSSVNAGDTVTLSSNVTDANIACGVAQTFSSRWSLVTRPTGSQAVLSSLTASSPTFVADRAGVYQASLTVTDSSGNFSDPTLFTLTTTTCGTGIPDVALSPSNATVNTGGSIALTATGSSSDNGSSCPASFAVTFNYSWALVGVPAGSRAALTSRIGPSVSLTPDLAGSYVVQVIPITSTGISGPARLITVTAAACGANAPAAVDVGTKPAFAAVQGIPGGGALVTSTLTPGTLDTGFVAQLFANVVDPDSTCGAAAQTFTESWSLLAVAYGSNARLANATSFAPSFTPDQPGDYYVQLVVTDSTGRSTTQVFKVTVGTCGASAPLAKIGVLSPFPVTAASSITASVPTLGPVQLDASASTDPDTAAPCSLPTSLSWRWSFVSLPAGANVFFNRADIVNPSFTPNVAGTYVIALVASDGTLSSSPAFATLTVSSSQFLVDRGVGPFTAIAADPSNGANPVIAYYDNANGAVRVARCTSGCSTGAPLFQYLPDVENGIGSLNGIGAPDEPRPVDVKVNAAGTIFVAYHTLTGPAPCSARVAAFKAGATAWNRKTVDAGVAGCRADGTNGTDRGRWLSLALTGAGNPALAWTRSDLGGAVQTANTRYAYCTGACGDVSPIWTPAAEVQSANLGEFQGRWPSLKITPTGGARLAYFIDGGGALPTAQLFFAGCDTCTSANPPPGNWARGAIEDSAGSNDVGRYVSLDLTSAGLPRVAYRDEQRNTLRYATCDAACTAGVVGWNRITVDNGGDVGTHPALVLDGSGNPRISYLDVANRDLRYAASAGGPFALFTLDNSGTIAGFTSMFLTSQGNPRISYFENGRNEVRYFAFGP